MTNSIQITSYDTHGIQITSYYTHGMVDLSVLKIDIFMHTWSYENAGIFAFHSMAEKG